MTDTTTRQIILAGAGEGWTNTRCAALAAFLARVAKAEGQSAVISAVPVRDAAETLRELAKLDTLLLQPLQSGEWEVRCRPSSLASATVFNDTKSDAIWPKRTQRDHADAFRISEGAIFRFPLEIGEEAIDVFITDWSPCPAACALAIHRGHRQASEPPQNDPHADSYFTGKFVRHPLTGDLLPVWVAGFVRPDFGTGAVLVNPAHDRTDLAFGRRLGLPIKFALVESNHDGSPATWPVAPVIKTGQALRTGICDGANFSEARAEYLKRLTSFGLAKTHKDINPGIWPIGTLVPDDTGAFAVRQANRELADPSENQELHYTFVPNDTLSAVLVQQLDSPITLVCAAGVAGQLLAFRLLREELTAPRPLIAKVETVQAVEGKDRAMPDPSYALATILMAKTTETASPKAQDVEQVVRFIAVHKELQSLAASANGHDENEQSILNAARNAKKALYRDGLSRGFAELYRLQKQLKEKIAGGTVPDNGYTAYLALAEVLVGLAPPQAIATSKIWSEL